jgi:hypothetical protein
MKIIQLSGLSATTFLIVTLPIITSVSSLLLTSPRDQMMAQSVSQLRACQRQILSTPDFSTLPKSEVELQAGGLSATGIAKIYWQVHTKGAFGYCQIGPAPAYAIDRYDIVVPFQDVPGNQCYTAKTVLPGSTHVREPQMSPNPNCWINLDRPS